MDNLGQVQTVTTVPDGMSAVSWGSIAAGGATAAAVSLPLFALGAGLGLSSISPWTDTGVSVSTFEWGSGVYLVLVAVMSSAIGGYLAARLRTKWIGIHTNEAFFRDTAHGLVAWALGTLITAAFLGAAMTHLLGGASMIAGQAAASANPAQVFVDRLFRSDGAQANAQAAGAPSPAGTNEPAGQTGRAQTNAAAAEVTRLWAYDYQTGTGLSDTDKAYVAKLVAARTGLSQADAEKRVNEVAQEAKAAADRARRAAAKLAFWMTAALLFGAFSASLAAVEGGQLRDGTWSERRIVPRAV